MEHYSITDLDGYARCVRDGAAKEFKENYTENLDDYISVGQIINLVAEKSIGVDDCDHYMINEDIHDEIYEDIQNWIFNIGLAKLAAAGKIECAWDDEENEMVFWSPSTNTEDQHEDAENNGA